MRFFKVLLTAAFIAAFFLPSAKAQIKMPCFDESPTTFLEGRGEKLIAQGITGSGFLMLIYANPDNGDYSIILIPPNEPLFCFGGAGHGFHLIEKKTGPGV